MRIESELRLMATYVLDLYPMRLPPGSVDAHEWCEVSSGTVRWQRRYNLHHMAQQVAIRLLGANLSTFVANILLCRWIEAGRRVEVNFKFIGLYPWALWRREIPFSTATCSSTILLPLLPTTIVPVSIQYRRVRATDRSVEQSDLTRQSPRPSSIAPANCPPTT